MVGNNILWPKLHTANCTTQTYIRTYQNTVLLHPKRVTRQTGTYFSWPIIFFSVTRYIPKYLLPRQTWHRPTPIIHANVNVKLCICTASFCSFKILFLCNSFFVDWSIKCAYGELEKSCGVALLPCRCGFHRIRWAADRLHDQRKSSPEDAHNRI